MTFDLKKHPVTLWMLVLTVAFYAFLFASSHARRLEVAATLQALSASDGEEKHPSERIHQKEARFRGNLLARPRLLSALSVGLILVFLTGLAVEFQWLSRCLRKKAVLAVPGRSRPRIAWGLTETAQLFVGTFFVEACLLGVEIVLSTRVHFSEETKDFLVVLNGFVRDLLIMGWVVLLVTRSKKAPLVSLGLTREDLLKNVWTGFWSYWGIVPILLVLLLWTSALAKMFSYEPPPQAVVEIYLKKSTESFIVFFTFFVAVLGPLFEEIFFRGFAYAAFRARFGAGLAMVVTAFIFSALHLSLAAFIPVFFLGLYLAYLYEKTGSLVPSMTAHVLHNVIMVGLTLGFKTLSS